MTDSRPITTLFVPGLRDHVADHWQTLMAERIPGSRTVEPLTENKLSRKARVAALDEIIAIRPPLDVVKLDVQGGEEAAVRGMERLLSASPGALLTLELSPADARAAGSDVHALLHYYRSLGFTLRVQLPDEKGLVDLDDDELLRRAEELEHVNLVLERHA